MRAYERMRGYGSAALDRMLGVVGWHQDRCHDRGLEEGGGYAALDDVRDAIAALQRAYDAGAGCKLPLASFAFINGRMVNTDGVTPDADDQAFLDLVAGVYAAVERAQTVAAEEWRGTWDRSKTAKDNHETARAFQAREMETTDMRALLGTVIAIGDDILEASDGLRSEHAAVLRAADRLADVPGYPGG